MFFMKIITLTTDFGLTDYSVGAIKGAIYSRCPDACIVDISHFISPFNAFQTAYVLKNAFCHYPKGSIHLIGVDDESHPRKKHLLMYFKGHYFIGADNGVFHLIAEDSSEAELYELTDERSEKFFPTLYFFPSIAQKIVNGVTLDQIGKRVDRWVENFRLEPNVSEKKDVIEGVVIYIDHYGNAVSNLSKKLFEKIRGGRNFEIIFNSYSFTKIYQYHSDLLVERNFSFVDGERMILFNDLGLLQVSIYKSNKETVGGASSLLGIYYLDKVTVLFDKK